jgi:hypothetical protein
MYFGVPIVGLVSAAVARLQPNGMARALFATALAQALVLAIAADYADYSKSTGYHMDTA